MCCVLAEETLKAWPDAQEQSVDPIEQPARGGEPP